MAGAGLLVAGAVVVGGIAWVLTRGTAGAENGGGGNGGNGTTPPIGNPPGAPPPTTGSPNFFSDPPTIT